MKIGVIMGGFSSERAVSLKTGRAMIETLNNLDYEVCEIVINEKEDIFNLPKIDFALLALHGKFGEDGSLQNYLEMLDIPYSGCNAVSSAMCMDKNITKKVLKASGIPTANWTTIKELSEKELGKAYALNYPVFVKPNSGGSSVATFKVKTKEDLIPAVTEALKWDMEVMVEEFMPGEEITCAMIDGQVLPIIKIDAKGEFFDLASKYNDGGADEYAVYFDEETQNKINDICVNTWDALGCEVYGRVDIIMGEQGMNVLEVNTLPGLTPASLFPKSAKAHGLTMEQLIDTVIKLSIEKRTLAKKKKESFIEMERKLGMSKN